jgi:hypothetical protein
VYTYFIKICDCDFYAVDKSWLWVELGRLLRLAAQTRILPFGMLESLIARNLSKQKSLKFQGFLGGKNRNFMLVKFHVIMLK